MDGCAQPNMAQSSMKSQATNELYMFGHYMAEHEVHGFECMDRRATCGAEVPCCRKSDMPRIAGNVTHA